MPGFRGTSAEFIPNYDIPRNQTGVFMLENLEQERFMLGHMMGGIVSPIRNPFEENRMHRACPADYIPTECNRARNKSPVE